MAPDAPLTKASASRSTIAEPTTAPSANAATSAACSGVLMPKPTTQGSPLVVQIAWNLKDPSTLVTVRVDCAEKYNNDPSSIASYCRNELTKE